MSRVGQFGQISEINDHLCLSGAGVMKPEKLKERGITCIINATTEAPQIHIPGVDYLKVRVDDSPQANLDLYFDMVADKIKQVRDHGGKTLVHCVAGVSRSATLCIVYLMKYQRLTLRQAYFHVKSMRTIIHPNPGFWRQMIAYEMRLTGRNTVRLKSASEGGDIPDVYSETRRAAIPALSFRSPNSQHSAASTQPSSASPRARNSKSANGATALAPPTSSALHRRPASPFSLHSTHRPNQPLHNNNGSLHNSPLTRHRNPNVTLPHHRYSHSQAHARKPSNFFSSLYDSHHAILFPNF